MEFAGGSLLYCRRSRVECTVKLSSMLEGIGGYGKAPEKAWGVSLKSRLKLEIWGSRMSDFY